MIDLLRVCRELKIACPAPSSEKTMVAVITKLSGTIPSKELWNDALKVVTKHWQRSGWQWDRYAAVKLDKYEDVIFNEKDVIIVSTVKSKDNVEITNIKYGKKHPKVIWF